MDAGGPGQGEKIVAAVRRLTKKPLRYLVNTSADAGSVGGNDAIVKAAGGTSGPASGAPNSGVMVISHEKALNRMMKGTPGFAALTGDALPGSSFFTPEKDFYANGEAVQLLYQPQAHSDGDVMVFFRGSDVISTGDIFRTDSYPVIDTREGRNAPGRAGRAEHDPGHHGSRAQSDGRHAGRSRATAGSATRPTCSSTATC